MPPESCLARLPGLVEPAEGRARGGDQAASPSAFPLRTYLGHGNKRTCETFRPTNCTFASLLVAVASLRKRTGYPVGCLETRRLQGLQKRGIKKDRPQRFAGHRPGRWGEALQAGACEDPGCPGMPGAAVGPPARRRRDPQGGESSERHAEVVRPEDGEDKGASSRAIALPPWRRPPSCPPPPAASTHSRGTAGRLCRSRDLPDRVVPAQRLS